MAADRVPTGVPSRANELIATAISCTILSVIFVALRMYTRLRINHATGWDDYVALLTLPVVIAYGVLTCWDTRYGMGLHAWDFPGDLRQQYQKWIFIGSPTYILSLLGYKMSICLLYLRIFNINRRFRYATYATMFMIFGYLFSNFWTQLFGCSPMSKSWILDEKGHCVDTIKSDYAYGSLNFISDLILFVLPLPMVWQLKMSGKDKAGISIIFMIGSLNWAVACTRFAYAVIDLTAKDRPWIAARTFLWSLIEVNTGLICSCVPVLRPFFRTYAVPTKAYGEKSLSYAKRKLSLSWAGTTLKGGEEGKTHHEDEAGAYIELERGKPQPPGKETVRDKYEAVSAYGSVIGNSDAGGVLAGSNDARRDERDEIESAERGGGRGRGSIDTRDGLEKAMAWPPRYLE